MVQETIKPRDKLVVLETPQGNHKHWRVEVAVSEFSV